MPFPHCIGCSRYSLVKIVSQLAFATIRETPRHQLNSYRSLSARLSVQMRVSAACSAAAASCLMMDWC